ITHLEAYRKEWDDKRGCWKDKPLHDYTSHDADGFRYFAVSRRNVKRLTKSLTFNWN
ncbi:terminase, partial [Morganella morganii]